MPNNKHCTDLSKTILNKFNLKPTKKTLFKRSIQTYIHFEGKLNYLATIELK